MSVMSCYLAPTVFITSTDPAVAEFARRATAGAADDRDRAVRLYYAVRDGIRYDPRSIRLTPEGFTASRCLAEGQGFCVTKAVLLAAAARACGIPARLGFADVRNHLATPRMIAMMRGETVLQWHAYTVLWIDGRWVKATPAFNRELCERFRVAPLEFDGRADSLFQPFNDDEHPFMEYVRDRGTFDDVPFDAIVEDFRRFEDVWASLDDEAAGSRVE